ncbi:MAG: hypothetical protein KKE57_06405, partial [Proteobacteria bacterium]|nr:hypothetical protein [Pseudomonadota bacterium]
MRCPKCGYISFDYNQVCPKCNKDISTEQNKLNIPAFRPDPPAMLGALVGESVETHMGLHGDSSGEMRFSSGQSLQFDDSAAIERGDIDFGDSRELSVGTEPELPGRAAEDLGDFEMGTEDGIADFELGGGEEEISVGPGRATLDEVESLLSDDVTEELGDDLSFDLEGASGETPELEPETTAKSTIEQDLGIDLESLSLDGEEAEEGQEEEEIELDLDDLDETGTSELELVAERAAAKDLEGALDIEDLSLDEIPLEEAPAEG